MSSPEDLLLARLLCERGLATEAQCRAATELQALETPIPSLARVLVQQGVLTPAQVEELVEAARVRRLVLADGATMAAPAPAAALPPETVASVPDGAATRGGTRSAAAAPLGSFGKYELLEELGRGGMGVVHRAFDRELRREVALKTLLHGGAPDSEPVQRLLREARTAAVLDHPGIVRIHEVGMVDGAPFIAMAYVRGRTLQEAFEAKAPAGARERVGWVHAAATAVAHAHGRGVVHRDLKPSNVMLEESGRVLVMDFGLARRLEEQTRLTATGQMLGTPQYMAPEQIDGDTEHIGPASDVYALGAVLYEALVGEPPFTGASVAEVLAKALRREPEPLRRRDSRIAVDLETICLKALAKEPERRYATAGEFGADLGRFLAGEAIAAAPERWWTRAGRAARRRKPLVGLAVALACAMLAGGWTWQRAERERLEKESERAARGQAERDRQRLHERILADLREKAGLWLEAALKLRRAGLPAAELREYGPRVEAAAAEAMREVPQAAEPHYHVGRMCRALMRFEDALQAQGEALARQPDHVPSLYERAIVAGRQYGVRVHQLRSAWMQSEGQRLKGLGALQQGSRGEQPRPAPTADELAARDPEAQRYRAWATGDLEKLRAHMSSPDGAERAGLTPAMVACAEGWYRMQQGREARESARTALERALAGDPMLEEAYEGLAELALAAGDHAGVVEAYTRGLAVDRGYVAHWTGRAMGRYDEGTARMLRGEDPGGAYAAAIEDLDHAVKLDPGFAEAWRRRGMVHANWGNWRADHGADAVELYSAATADFDRVVALDPASAAGWTGRGLARASWGIALQSTGRDPMELFSAAVADFGEGLKRSPGEAEAWAFRAMVRGNVAVFLLRRGDDPRESFGAAIADLDRSLELDPSRTESWRLRGMVRSFEGLWLLMRGEDPAAAFAGSVADYRKALEIDPHSAGLWRDLGSAQASWAQFEAGRGIDPRPRFAEGLASLDRALAIHASYAEAWRSRGLMLSNWANHEERAGGDCDTRYATALADFGRALEINPTHAEAWGQRAVVATHRARAGAKRGQDPGPGYDAAAADFGRALELNPASAETWRNRGILHVDRAMLANRRGADPSVSWTAALADFGKALQLNPADVEAWIRRGQVHTNLGVLESGHGGDSRERFRLSAEDYGKALELQPGLAGAWAGRGLARFNLAGQEADAGGDAGEGFAGAVADLGKSLELNPAAPASVWMRRGLARAAWAVYRRDQGEDVSALVAEAESDFERSLAMSPRDAETLWRRGWLRHATGRWAEAVADFESARALQPAGEASYRTQLADAHLQLARGFARGSAVAAAADAASARDRAFLHLAEAVRLGATDAERLQQDEALAGLGEDPRWNALLGRGSGKR